MLIGKHGSFILKPPFTKYTTTGLAGKIVGVNYVQHLVSKGQDVKGKVYRPVDAENLYANDLRKNVIIVTIKTLGGKKYEIPDIYIENLYDDNLNFVDAYVTVKIGNLPRSYDYAYIRTQLATEVTKLSGVTVKPTDVYISAQDNGQIYSQEEYNFLDATRLANISNLTTDYGKYVTQLKENQLLKSKVNSLEKTVRDFIG